MPVGTADWGQAHEHIVPPPAHPTPHHDYTEEGKHWI